MKFGKGNWPRAGLIAFGAGVFALHSPSASNLVERLKPGPLYFEGGPSGIDSNDPDRALKAMRKWSDSGEWPDEIDPEKAPFFWDFTKVGRPVFIRIIKNSNLNGSLEVWLEETDSDQFEFYKAYRIAFYSGGPGPKTEEGDMQAPEGFYSLSRQRMNPHSSYHLSMDLGYPNEYDRRKKRSGSFLMIHGKAESLGCFAMSDASVEQIYTLVSEALENGQTSVPVHSFPFPMTHENVEDHCDNEHHDFWQNLREGWEWFELRRRPPQVSIKDGRYTFGPDR